MGVKPIILVLVFCLPILSGCLVQEEVNPTMVDLIETEAEQFDTQGRESVIGGISNQNISNQQRDMLNSMIQHHRSEDFNISDIPLEGGNWTHYFACSGGQKIEYKYPMPDHFSCKGTDEILTGEQYETTWVAYRHKEVIRESGVKSAVAYFLTNETESGERARDILLHYADIYDGLPVQDKFGNKESAGGKLTRQSLDEAVLLIDLAWIQYLIQPMLTDEENMNITSGLILPMVETLEIPANQNRGALSNWFSYHNAAIGMAAVSTNNLSMMEESLNQWNGLYHQLGNGFDEDGLWHEGSIAYHNYTLTAMAINIDAARYFDIELANYSWTTKSGSPMVIYEPFVSHLTLIKPDGTFPRLNDDIQGTDLSSIRDLLEFTNRNWPKKVPSSLLQQARDMNDFLSLRSSLWMVPINHSSTNLTSLNYESFGLSIIRHNDMYVLLDYGPHGGWHGHYDKLNIEVASGKTNLISDPGTVVYSLPSSRDWYRTSLAHSLPFIGFENQPETTGHLLNHNFSNDFSFVMAQYSDESAFMNITRFILVLETIQYGDVIIDVSHWSGLTPQIATQTYHFDNTLQWTSDGEYGNSSSGLDLYPYAHLDRIEVNQTLEFNSGPYWNAVLHLSEGNDLYEGTSINGGAFFLQSNQFPSTNSTMFSMYLHDAPVGGVLYDYSSTNSLSQISISNRMIVIDWDSCGVSID